VTTEDWEQNIKERNQKVIAGISTDYFLDDGLLNKLNALFEVPEEAEISYWHYDERK